MIISNLLRKQKLVERETELKLVVSKLQFPVSGLFQRTYPFSYPLFAGQKDIFELTNFHLIPQFYLHVTMHFVCINCLLKMPH